MEDQNNYYQDNTQNVEPSYQAPEEPQPKNKTLAIVSLVTGILSIVSCCTCILPFGFGIAGIVCAIISNKRGKNGLATAGLICSIVGIALVIIMIGIILYEWVVDESFRTGFTEGFYEYY
jgi:hypothetical protein